MTSQTDNQIGNLCSDFHCSILFHTLKKIITSLLVVQIYSNFFRLFCRIFLGVDLAFNNLEIEHLTSIFRMIYNTGHILEDLKKSIFLPISKKPKASV